MTDNTKDFCLVRKGMIKDIPQKTWIRYITKKDMIVNKGGMLLKNNIEDKKESYLLLKSPYGPMWRVKPNENHIYIDKKIVEEIKDKGKKIEKKNTKKKNIVKNNKKTTTTKNTKNKKNSKRKTTNKVKKTKVIKLDI